MNGKSKNTQVFQGLIIFDRELNPKVLKEALLLLFLLLEAWNHEQKMFQMEQKMFANKFVTSRKNVTKGKCSQ